MTHVLQQGHTSYSFPTSFTNWGPSDQAYEPVEAFLIQTTVLNNRIYLLSHLEVSLSLSICCCCLTESCFLARLALNLGSSYFNFLRFTSMCCNFWFLLLIFYCMCMLEFHFFLMVIYFLMYIFPCILANMNIHLQFLAWMLSLLILYCCDKIP